MVLNQNDIINQIKKQLFEGGKEKGVNFLTLQAIVYFCLETNNFDTI
jgi:hypothetical protein